MIPTFIYFIYDNDLIMVVHIFYTNSIHNVAGKHMFAWSRDNKENLLSTNNMYV